MSDWKCWIGLHAWQQDRPLRTYDMWPMKPDYETPIRTCQRCGKEQQWLPGYGGSEIGCWTNKRAA